MTDPLGISIIGLSRVSNFPQLSVLQITCRYIIFYRRSLLRFLLRLDTCRIVSGAIAQIEYYVDS